MNGNFCPKCGTQISNGNTNFCPGCGANIGGGYGSDPIFGSNQSYNGYNQPYGSNQSYGGVESFNLVSAYKSMFRKYAQFNGRSRRSEYWLASIASSLIVFAMYILMFIVTAGSIGYGAFSPRGFGIDDIAGWGGLVMIIWIAMCVYSIIMIIPSLSMTVRRLHDTGKSAWWLLITLVPYVGGIILFVFMVLDSQPGTNRYGANPKDGSGASQVWNQIL